MTTQRFPEELKPLAKPAFGSIRIKPGALKRFTVIDHRFGEDHDFMQRAPDHLAELSTYAIELTCLDTPDDLRGRQKYQRRIEKLLSHLRHSEPYAGWEKPSDQAEQSPYYDSDKEESRERLGFRPFPVTIDWSQNPPLLKAEGFSLDMLGGMIDYHFIEPSLEAAKEFKAASRMEYRGPILTIRDTAELTSLSDYSRHISLEQGLNFGDFGAAEPQRQYDTAIEQLQRMLASGLIQKQEFARAVTLVAHSTLKGLLPSPHASEQKLLDDGMHADTEDGRKQMLAQRIEEVVADVLGPNQALNWNTNSGEQTLDAHAKRLQEELTRKDNAHNAQAFEQAKALFAQLKDHLIQGQKEAQEADRAGSFAKSLEGAILKDKLSHGVRHEQALAVSNDMPMPDGLDWNQLTFFGVQLPKTDELYPGYLSRNPLIDPPRPIHARLQELLDRDAHEAGLRAKYQRPDGSSGQARG